MDKLASGKDKTGASFLSVEDADRLKASLVRTTSNPFDPPRAFKITDQGRVLRAIWNRLEIRNPTEHFQEFLIDILKRTLSIGWIQLELSKPAKQQHVVVRWLVEYSELTKRFTPDAHQPGQFLGVPATGGATELILLARDLYYLQLVHQIPTRFIDRLRDHNQFQGARYEAAVAAALLLGGFRIEWIREKVKCHCEFYAIQQYTLERTAVEAKSRRRPGVLNEPVVSVTVPENHRIA